eukprot:3277009-Prymnesium_polylepis.1
MPRGWPVSLSVGKRTESGAGHECSSRSSRSASSVASSAGERRARAAFLLALRAGAEGTGRCDTA